jgi:hypothetical protein
MCRAVSSYARIPLNEKAQKRARPAATEAAARRASRGRGRVRGVRHGVVVLGAAPGAPEHGLGWREEDESIFAFFFSKKKK